MVLVGDTLVYSASGVYVYEIGHGSKPRLIQTLQPSPDGAVANALAVSRNHIIIGTNYDGRGGFFEGAEVLTYPKTSAVSSSDSDE